MSELRCAFCHDALVEGGVGADERVECAGCKTVLHWDCRALLARCPTIGCKDASFVKGDRVPVGRPAFHSALARLTANRPTQPAAPDPAIAGSDCEVCSGSWSLLLNWVCPTCGAWRHFSCQLMSSGHMCARPNDIAPMPLKTIEEVDPNEGRPDPEPKKRALDNLKKRPKRD